MPEPMMTDPEWLRSADAILLLDHLFPMHGHHSTPEQPRKLRLYYAACARRIEKRLPDAHRALVEAAERLADDRLSASALAELRTIGEELVKGDAADTELIEKIAGVIGSPGQRRSSVVRPPESEFSRLARLVFQPLIEEIPSPLWVHRSLHSADIVRDVFPNPFRAPVWQDDYRTPDVLGIAARMYETRQFEAMGPLADALEEAGCEDPEILLHCRDQESLHYRGCWVIDRILAEEHRTLISACSG